MTAGKRPRLMMRRTVSVASLGAQAASSGSDHPFDHQKQQQQQQSPAPPYQVIGFAPKAFSDNDSKLVLQDTNMVFAEPPYSSSSHSASSSPSGPRSGSIKPFSGFSLLSDSITNKDLHSNSNSDAAAAAAAAAAAEKVGLGIVAALNKDEVVSAACSPIFRSSTAIVNSPNHHHHHYHHQAAAAPPPPPVVPVRYLPPPDFSANRKQKAAAVAESGGTNLQFCFQSNSAKPDRCSLRPPSFTTLGFLESCFQCKRDISHGQDIYMYRGDRAFCSAECRHQQILKDERLERRVKCSSAALKQIGGGNPQPARGHHHQRNQVSSTTAPATTAAAA